MASGQKRNAYMQDSSYALPAVRNTTKLS